MSEPWNIKKEEKNVVNINRSTYNRLSAFEFSKLCLMNETKL